MKKITKIQIDSFLKNWEKMDSFLKAISSFLEVPVTIVKHKYVTHKMNPRVQIEGFQINVMTDLGELEIIFDTKPSTATIKTSVLNISYLYHIKITRNEYFLVNDICQTVSFDRRTKSLLCADSSYDMFETIAFVDSDLHKTLINLINP